MVHTDANQYTLVEVLLQEQEVDGDVVWKK